MNRPLELTTTQLPLEEVELSSNSGLIEIAAPWQLRSAFSDLGNLIELKARIFENGGAMEYKGRLFLLIFPQEFSVNSPSVYPELEIPFWQWVEYYQLEEVRVWGGGEGLIYADQTIDPVGRIPVHKIGEMLREVH